MLSIVLILLAFVHVLTAQYTCCDDGYEIELDSDNSDNNTNAMICYDPITEYGTNLSIYNTQNCKMQALYLQDGQYNYTITDGKLEMFENGIKELDSGKDQFCEGNFTVYNGNVSAAIRQAVVVCFSIDESKDQTILAYCMIVSVVFFAFTVLVYASFSELRDLHGKSIINLCSSFGISLVFFIIMELSPSEIGCAQKGFLAYFFMVASFFWMNSICIQILLSIRQQRENPRGWREFVYYSIYSWGMTTIFTVWVIVANYVPGNHLPPLIGYKTCWFYKKQAQWLYMYSVLTVLIVMNICVFIYVSMMLWHYSSTYVKSIKYKLGMVMRLLVVMGVAWIFEIAASVHGQSHIIWFIFDIYNSLQGLMIFLILVVFRRRAVHAMYKHGWLCCCNDTVEKYLAKDNDEEGTTIQHTIVVPLEQRD